MKKILLILFVLPLTYGISLGQDTPSQPSPDFPDYIVRPSEDLNPYGLSSLGTSTEEGAINDAAGSLGSSTSNRPSNIDVNKSIADKKAQKAEEEKAAQAKREQAQSGIIEEEVVEYNKLSGSRVKGSSNMIKWVDNKGIVHITNNIGSVPPEYRDQIK